MTSMGFYNDTNTSQIQLLLERLTYKDGWEFGIHGFADYYRVLEIRLTTKDATQPADSDVKNIVTHHFAIPNIFIPEQGVEEWILECILKVEQHEACEFLKIDGVAIFHPEHGENSNPYRIKRR